MKWSYISSSNALRIDTIGGSFVGELNAQAINPPETCDTPENPSRHQFVCISVRLLVHRYLKLPQLSVQDRSVYAQEICCTRFVVVSRGQRKANSILLRPMLNAP